MVKSAVRVHVRVRPCAGLNPHAQYNTNQKGVSLTVFRSAGERGGLLDRQPQTYQFKFDGVLKDVEQDEVYEACASEVLQSGLDGFNGTIMCYGQTGAGKTYTMSGGRSNFKERGIIPRTLSQLFAKIQNLSDRQFKIRIQYLEIYNESLFDLLDITTQPHEINIQEVRGNVAVTGIKSKVVRSEAEAMKLLFEGETNRVIGEHQLNRESSRSHSIFTIHIEMKMAGEQGEIITSKVNLVDLAGSERVSKTKSEGLVLKEAGHINKSLSALEHVIVALSEKGRDHVPFRSSKLTHVLKDSLGGNCKTVLVANVWGETSQMDETLSTCRFAQRMMNVTCEVTANVVQDQSAQAKQMQRQIAELQQELAMHDSMASRKDVKYSPYNEAQRAELRTLVASFLASTSSSDSIEPLDLMSVRHMREILMSCRELYQSASVNGSGKARAMAEPAREYASGSSAGENNSSASALDGARAATAAALAAVAAAAAASSGNEFVGDDDIDSTRHQAGGVGLAPDDARPGSEAGGPEHGGGADAADRRLATQLQDDDGDKDDDARKPPSAGSKPPRGNRQEALEAFRSGPGTAKSALLEENRSRLKISKRRAKDLGLSINGTKRELDTLKQKAEDLKSQRQSQTGEGAGQVLDPEEYSALMRIKDLKLNYREQFSELQMVRSEVEYTQQLCDTCAQELAMEFNEWFSNVSGGGGEPSAVGTEDSNIEGDVRRSEGIASPTVSPSAKSHVARSAHTSVSSVSRPSIYASSGGDLSSPPASGGKVQSPSIPRGAARRPPAAAAAAASRPAAEDASDPEAAAFYAAQQLLIDKTTNVAHRPGSAKKNRAVATSSFGATPKRDILGLPMGPLP